MDPFFRSYKSRPIPPLHSHANAMEQDSYTSSNIVNRRWNKHHGWRDAECFKDERHTLAKKASFRKSCARQAAWPRSPCTELDDPAWKLASTSKDHDAQDWLGKITLAPPSSGLDFCRPFPVWPAVREGGIGPKHLQGQRCPGGGAKFTSWKVRIFFEPILKIWWMFHLQNHTHEDMV